MSGDFNPPFGSNSDWRLATPTEKDLGFPCGALDQRLLNGLFRLLLGNIRDIAQEAGVSSNDTGDQTVLKRAVLALIEAAIGEMDEGELDLSNLILMSQAQNRLPIFPEIENSTNTIVPAVPDTGSIQVPSGIDFLHRGIRRFSTSDWDSENRTFETDPSTIYHLRWHRDTGFSLNDLADSGYNPGSEDETDEDFDTDYDDMLIARVLTNSSNVATITGLKNAAHLAHSEEVTFTSGSGMGENNEDHSGSLTFDWARTPIAIPSVTRRRNDGEMPDNDISLQSRSLSRYSISETWNVDYASSFRITWFLRA